MTARVPRPFDEPEGYRAMVFGEALQYAGLTFNKFAALHKVGFYALMKALVAPDDAPQIINAVDTFIADYLEAVGDA
jgi:hypothetical protein